GRDRLPRRERPHRRAGSIPPRGPAGAAGRARGVMAVQIARGDRARRTTGSAGSPRNRGPAGAGPGHGGCSRPGMGGWFLLAAIVCGYAYEVLLLGRTGWSGSVEPPAFAHAPKRRGVDAEPGRGLLEGGGIREHRTHVPPLELLEGDVPSSSRAWRGIPGREDMVRKFRRTNRPAG